MPQVFIPAAAGAAAGAIGLSTATLFGSAIIGGAVLYGGFALISYLLTPKANQRFSTASPDIKTTIRSGVVPARWILGRARSAGVLAYILEPTDTDKDIHMILLLSEGDIGGIERVWLNGDEIEWTSDNGSRSEGSVMPEFEESIPVEGNKYRGALVFRPYYNGIPDSTPITTIAGSKWTNSHTLTGKAAVHIKLTQPDYTDPKGRIYNGLPNFEFLIKGQKIKWPGQTESKWTNNAAALRAWWLTNRRAVPETAIDRASFDSAFAYCGTEIDNRLPDKYGVHYPAKSPRYMINGVLQSTDDHTQVESEMDFCWAGNVIESGGKHFFRPGRDDNIGRALPRITSEEIISRVSIQPAPALSDRINAATMRLAQSSASDYLEAGVPEFVDSEGETRDGERLPKDLGVRTFVCCPSSAGRLMAVALRRARAFKRYEIMITPGPQLQRLSLLPSDLVTYHDPELGVNNVRCVVVATQQNADYSLSLTLEQQLQNTHADSVVLPPLYGSGRVLPREKPLAPQGVKAVAAVSTTRDNTAQSLIRISWNPSPHTALVKIVGPTSLSNVFTNEVSVFATEITLPVPFPGTYAVSVRNRDRRGNISDAAEVSVEVDWTDIPDAVDITKITQNDNGTITITYDTGNSVTIGTGKGIKSITRNARTGEVVVTYTDNTTQSFPLNDGAEGGTTEWIYFTSSGVRPATPTTTAAQKTEVDFVPEGWLDDPPERALSSVWVSSRKRPNGNEPFSDFSTPSPFRGPTGSRGRTGPTGPQGPQGIPAPRYWVLLHTGTGTASTATLPANVSTYRWLMCFGRGGAVFSWSAAVDTKQLIAHKEYRLQSISGQNAFWAPFISYKDTAPNQVSFRYLYSEWNQAIYVDEIWGVNFITPT